MCLLLSTFMCCVSNDEGFGRVVVEAAAVRIPTVASNVGGIPELIRHGETGYLLGGDRAADDNAFRACLDQFVAAVEELARNTELRARMGAAAYEYAKRQFSPEVYAHQMMRVFDEAIEDLKPLSRLGKPASPRAARHSVICAGSFCLPR